MPTFTVRLTHENGSTHEARGMSERAARAHAYAMTHPEARGMSWVACWVRAEVLEEVGA